APVARVALRDPRTGATATDVPLLIDTGADVTLLPRGVLSRLGMTALPEEHYEVMGFDGHRSFASVVVLEMRLLQRVFRGRYLLLDQDHGIMGRDILNHLV